MVLDDQLFVDWIGTSAAASDVTAEEVMDITTELLSKARSQWPQLTMSDAEFVPHLLSKAPSIAALSSIRAGDLFLACAVLRRVPGAVEAFDRHCLSDAFAHLRHLQGMNADADTDDALQSIRERLVVGTGDRPGRLSAYSGRGDIRSFVRIAAVREWLGYRRRCGRELAVDDEDLAMIIQAADEEHRMLPPELRGRFRSAFSVALRSLSPRQRNLLRYRYLDGLPVARISQLYRAHRVTVSRWLSDIREILKDKTNEMLRAELRADSAEVESLLRIARSQLEVSVERMLGREKSQE